MDNKIVNIKEEVDFTDNNEKLEKLKKSYLILKQKVCRSHDLIKLYNDKLKECERMKVDLDLANKETKKMTSNYNGTLAKVIKLELQNTEYKKNIESLSNTVASHETKMAGDRQHLQQLTCKMKELEEKHMDKIMQLDLDKSLLQEKIKELELQLKISNKNCDLSKKKINKRQQNIENSTNSHSERTIQTTDVGVNTVPNKISTVDTAMNTVSNAILKVDVAVNTVDKDMKHSALVEKCVMTDISCNMDKDDLYPLFCNECESMLSDPYDKICRSMIKHPRLIETISSPIKSLSTIAVSMSSCERDANLTNNEDNETYDLERSVEDTNVHNNSSSPVSISLPELSSQGGHIISKPCINLAIQQSVSNEFNSLSNTGQTACLINESNDLSNVTVSTNSVNVLEKLEEKVKRLEKKIKQQSSKKKQLSTNHLQYLPHLNYFPNDVLSHNLSLNMASTFWNQVKNLMNVVEKKDKHIEKKKRKKRHEPKLCKFSSKKIKLKQQLKQLNKSKHHNVWNIDSITSSHVQTKTVDDSSITRLEHEVVNVLSDLSDNEIESNNCSSDVRVDEDESCDIVMQENTKNNILFSTPKETLQAVDIQCKQSPKFSLFENMEDDLEETNSSDLNDTQLCAPKAEMTVQPNDTSPIEEAVDIENRNYFKNKSNNAITITTTNNNTNDIDATTNKASTTSLSISTNNKFNESETDKQANISFIDEFASTEFTLDKTSQVISEANHENKLNNYITVANSIAITDTTSIANITTAVTCLTSTTITSTSKSSTNYCATSIATTPVSIATKAQKRKLQCNSMTDLLAVERNNEKDYNFENNDNKKVKSVSEKVINDKCDTSFENCISKKKQRIAYKVKELNNHEISTLCNENQNPQNITDSPSYKTSNSVIIHTNLTETSNVNDAFEINDMIPQESKSTETTVVNSSDFTPMKEHEDECMQEQDNNETFKAGHSNIKMINDSHLKFKCASNKTVQSRLMTNLKNLRSRPPCKISDLELFTSNEPIISDDQNYNKDRCKSQNLHGINSEIKNDLIKYHNDINVKKECKQKQQSKFIDIGIRQIDGTSPKEKSNLCNDLHEDCMKKQSSTANTEELSGVERIMCEREREIKEFPLINDTNKTRKRSFEASMHTTDITVHNKNNVDKRSHNMEVVATENIENINSKISMSTEVVNPTMLLEKHFNENTNLKSSKSSKKVLKEMMQISKTIDNFVREQLHKIISNGEWGMSAHNDVVNKLSSTCTPRIVAKGIVEFMLDDKAAHFLDNTFTPPAPLMTPLQQKIAALLVDLETKMPTVIKLVQAGIEFKIFRLNKTPMLQQVQNLIRLYVVLTRIQKDREKARMLCCSALYCLGLHAVPVIYTVLTSWPEVLPQFKENSDMLPKCMAHIIVSLQAMDFPQLHSLKCLISNYYNFKAGNYLTKTLMDEALSSLEENHSSNGISGLRTAIILLAKKEGTSWTYANVIKANLLPNIVHRKYASMYEAFCLLGHLLRTFPVSDNDSIVKNIIEQLSDLIESGEGSQDQQEGIISALLSLSRHNFPKVAESVMKWTPTKPLRKNTIDQYHALFKFRSSMHWKNVLKKATSKV